MADLELGIAGGAQTVRLKVGETIDLWVEENPTTGFLWQQAAGRAEAGALSLERLDLRQQRGGGIGAMGQRHLRLRAERSGTHLLVLELRQSWESGSPRARIEVTVEAE